MWLFFPVLFLFAVAISKETKSVRTNSSTAARVHPPGIPVSLKSNEIIVEHTAYVLSYSEAHEQASWVSYLLTRAHTTPKYKRSDRFLPDPKIPTGSATNADYRNSGYDRGHLAPAADMSWSEIAMRESFYYSNMSPQLPAFNRGVWKRLEEQIRDWANKYDSLYIVTGGVLTEGLPTIGINKVSVPRYYYKVLYRKEGALHFGIGFVLPNAASSQTLPKFALSIDQVEKITGIDFFPMLPDSIEQKVESMTGYW